MDIVGIIETFGRIKLIDREANAYEAPYPTGEYKAGAHVWPYLRSRERVLGQCVQLFSQHLLSNR